jgi:YD repeat-containing protein
VQGARSWSYGYDSKGRLAWSRDPLQRTDSLYYDDADRLIRPVLTGRQRNSLRPRRVRQPDEPPSRPAHGFAFDALDQDSVYLRPSLGAGSRSTENRYDLGGYSEDGHRIVTMNGSSFLANWD